MNCWRFDARIFDACRAVPPSPRGELELPAAVALAVARGVAFKVLPAAGPVLDLSQRADAPDVARGLVGHDAAAMTGDRSSRRLAAHGLDDIERRPQTRCCATWCCGRFTHSAASPDAGAVGAGTDRGVRQAHRLLRRPLAGGAGAARVRLRRPRRAIGPGRVDAATRSRARAVRHRRSTPSMPRRAPRCRGASNAERRHRLAPLRGDDGAAAARATFPARIARRGHRVRERPAALLWHEQLERADGRPCGGAGPPRPASRRGPSGAPRSRSAARRGRLLRVHRERPVVRGLAGDAGVGTHGGSEDHVALICGRAGQRERVALRADSARRPTSRFPADWTFVIASSGVAAKKTGGARDAYNRLSLLRRDRCSISGTRGAAGSSSLRAALSTDVTAPERLLRSSATDRLRRLSAAHADPAPTSSDRLTHFVAKTRAIPAAVDAFRAADRDRIATLSSRLASPTPSGCCGTRCRKRSPSRARPGAWAPSAPRASAPASAAASGRSSTHMTQPISPLAGCRTTESVFPAREAATVFVAPPGPSLTWLES